jgi:hypothetical protein
LSDLRQAVKKQNYFGDGIGLGATVVSTPVVVIALVVVVVLVVVVLVVVVVVGFVLQTKILSEIKKPKCSEFHTKYLRWIGRTFCRRCWYHCWLRCLQINTIKIGETCRLTE